MNFASAVAPLNTVDKSFDSIHGFRLLEVCEMAIPGRGLFEIVFYYFFLLFGNRGLKTS